MPRLTVRVPKYCQHKASGQAYVTLDGHTYYLGPHASKASLLEYDRLIALWQANGRRMPGTDKPDITIAELLVPYLKFAQGYYRKNGEITTEVDALRAAMRPLVKLFAETLVSNFGPLSLKAVRDDMIRLRWCRTSINKHIDRIKRIFRWGVENELVPAEVSHALATVPGLRRGRCDAMESDPVTPVPDAHIEAVNRCVRS